MQKNNRTNIKNLLLFAPFITFLLGYVGSLAYVHVSTLRVPNVVGKSIHDASLLLAKNNIALKVLSEKEDSSSQEGTIVSQIPSADQDIKLSRPLLVVLAKKPKPVRMPDLSLKGVREINEIGLDLQRKIKIVNLIKNYADEKCFAQAPNAHSELEDAKIVAYIAIKSTRLHLVPSFIGLRLSDVEEALKNQRVSYEIIDYDEQTGTGQETFIKDQAPISGTIMPLEKIHMQFSCGNR